MFVAPLKIPRSLMWTARRRLYLNHKATGVEKIQIQNIPLLQSTAKANSLIISMSMQFMEKFPLQISKIIFQIKVLKKFISFWTKHSKEFLNLEYPKLTSTDSSLRLHFKKFSITWIMILKVRMIYSLSCSIKTSNLEANLKAIYSQKMKCNSFLLAELESMISHFHLHRQLLTSRRIREFVRRETSELSRMSLILSMMKIARILKGWREERKETETTSPPAQIKPNCRLIIQKLAQGQRQHLQMLQSLEMNIA